MKTMHHKMDRAVKKMNNADKDFEETKDGMLEIGGYTHKDKFISSTYQKGLETNLVNARIAWTTDESSINERIKKYQHLFEDPSRLPYYDEKGKYWNLSSKFNVEENDEA